MRAPIELSVPYDYVDLYNIMVVKEAAAAEIQTAIAEILNMANRSRYETVELATDVPWQVIACLHYRESDLDFTTHLYNGDSLKRRTVNEPVGHPIADPIAGAGKPYAWTESAADSLRYDGAKLGMGIDNTPGWSINEMLYFFEKYNGFGYRKYHSILSPYLWSGTEYYKSGKYASDGHYDASEVDKQLGCATLLKALHYS